MHEESRSGARLRLLALSGVGALAGVGLLWASQAVPSLRISSSLLCEVACWLVAYFRFALKTCQAAPRFAWVSRAIAVTVAAHQDADVPEPVAVRMDLASGRLCRACGYVAAAAAAGMVALDVLLALGVIRLTGVNLVLTTLLVLGVAGECAFVRVVGPQAAAAGASIGLARAAARHGDHGPFTLLEGGAAPEDNGHSRRC